MYRILLYTFLIKFLLVAFFTEQVEVAKIRPLTRFEQVQDIIQSLLYPRGYKKYWSRYQIEKTTEEILRTERVTGEHFTMILATIELESRFRYWVKSAPNLNGTRDLGLTQQNSDYYQHRCKKVLGRTCTKRDVFTPWISVKLMRWRLIECGRFSGENRFLCYNSARNVGRRTRYQISWRRAYYKVLRLWKKTKNPLKVNNLKNQ